MPNKVTKGDNKGLFRPSLSVKWKTQDMSNFSGTTKGGGDRLTRVVSESHFLAKHWNSCSLQEVRACCTCDGRPLGLFTHT